MLNSLGLVCHLLATNFIIEASASEERLSVMMHRNLQDVGMIMEDVKELMEKQDNIEQHIAEVTTYMLTACTCILLGSGFIMYK